MVATVLVFGMVSCDQEVKTKTYKVTYNANGAVGNVLATIEVEEGGTATVPSCDSLSMKGYDFVGWNTKKDGSGRAYKESQSIKVDYDIALYAQWSIHEYSISYELDGGSYPEDRSNPTTYTIETESFTLNSPEKDGYEFLGWTTSEDEEPNKNVSIDKGTTGDLSFTAVWRLEFSIRYDANGGEGYIGRTYKQKGESSEIATASGISREGYSFVCWNTSMDGSGMNYNPGSLYHNDADLVLYAIWRESPLVYSYVVHSDSYCVTGCKDKEVSSIVIPQVYKDRPVIGIDDYAFSECSSLSEIVIPESVTYIGRCAFSGCSELSSVALPSSVTSIGESAFFDCGRLKKVVIPEGIAEIKKSSFSKCSNLTNITIPSSVRKIGDYAFSDCNSLTSVIILGNIECVGDYAFSGCCVLSSVVLPSSITDIGRFAFLDCKELKSLIIPEGITIIEEGVFQGSGLIEISMPSSVTNIKKTAFRNCSRLANLRIPKKVTGIGENAFSGCSELESILVDDVNPCFYSKGNCLIEKTYKILVLGCKNSVIPKDVKMIGSSAFYKCSGLKEITIPSTISSMDTLAFADCDYLFDIYYDGTSYEWVRMISGARAWLWDAGTPNYTVHFSDGTMLKKEQIIY